ncbi:anoctamin-8-like [Panonychus citri]|uniref:anoctamin-8-like n=1 Tax=Panonychus citri TaxID=50023 RepID=UPI002307ABA2|nr:anoctamin-8-like [Panonychus citri]
MSSEEESMTLLGDSISIHDSVPFCPKESQLTDREPPIELNNTTNAINRQRIKEQFRKQKEALVRLIEKQRHQLEEGGKHLIWKRKSEQSLDHDVVIIFPPKGYPMMDCLQNLINRLVPQLVLESKSLTNNNEQAFYVSAEPEWLQEAAIFLGYLDNNPVNRYKSQQSASSSCLSSPLTPTTPASCCPILSAATRQNIIRYYLNTLRWFKESSSFDDNLVNQMKLIDGEAIIPKLLQLGYIKQLLPLHNEEELSSLRKSWVSDFTSSQPLEEIYSYFGVKIALYFAFLGHYTYSLLLPGLFGLLISVTCSDQWSSDLCLTLFPIILTVWSSLYLESWKKYGTTLTDQWSSTTSTSRSNQSELIDIRPQFHGVVTRKDSQGIAEIFYPHWKRKLFFYLITIPVMGLSLLIVFLSMFYMLHFQTWWDNIAIGEQFYPKWTSYFPKVLFGLVIHILDVVYEKLALWLNNKENYQYQETYESNLMIKLVLFQFVNSFLSLFYIAFYIGDMAKLREQMIALLITRQVIGNIKESLWPFLTQSYKLSPTLASTEVTQAELESSLYSYESTFEDYLELFIQFGYVTLFSVTFPLAAFCALINNLIEIRSDAFKLCVTYQRPFSIQGNRNLLIWQKAINIMIYVSIVVNCSLLVKSGQLERLLPMLNQSQIIITGVIIEHLLIIIKLAIEKFDWKSTINSCILNYKQLIVKSTVNQEEQEQESETNKKID